MYRPNYVIKVLKLKEDHLSRCRCGDFYPKLSGLHYVESQRDKEVQTAICVCRNCGRYAPADQERIVAKLDVDGWIEKNSDPFAFLLEG